MNARRFKYSLSTHSFTWNQLKHPHQGSNYPVATLLSAFVANSLKRTVGVLFFVFLCGSAKRVNTLISTLDLPWMNQKE